VDTLHILHFLDEDINFLLLLITDGLLIIFRLGLHLD